MSRHVTMATWDDVPHLSPETQAELLASIPPWQRDARTKGVPQLGSGVIYPVSESDIAVDPFDIPKHWPRAFGMDCGGGNKATAAVWGAVNPETHVRYLYSEHKGASAEPVLHATAIKARGVWIPGRADAAALIMKDDDVEQLLAVYRRLGLLIELPDKAVETGIYEVWTLLSTGLLKVFKTLPGWLEEYRLYRRDAKGRIVKENDHLMDATRYLNLQGTSWWKAVPPRAADPTNTRVVREGQRDLGWMA